MKFRRKLVCTGSFLFLFYTAPAFAQFEVNPDHFDNTMSHTPPKATVVPKRQAPRQHLGTGAAALRQSLARESQGRAARTGPEKTQVVLYQLRSAGQVPLGARASANVQPKHLGVPVARAARE